MHTAAVVAQCTRQQWLESDSSGRSDDSSGRSLTAAVSDGSSTGQQQSCKHKYFPNVTPIVLYSSNCLTPTQTHAHIFLYFTNTCRNALHSELLPICTDDVSALFTRVTGIESYGSCSDQTFFPTLTLRPFQHRLRTLQRLVFLPRNRSALVSSLTFATPPNV